MNRIPFLLLLLLSARLFSETVYCQSIRTPSGPLSEATVVGRIRETYEAQRFDPCPLGIRIESMSRDGVLYEKDADLPLLPASNMKIITSAAGLCRLGAEYRYRTRLLCAGEIRGDLLDGDLILVGAGDPTFGAPSYGDPTALFEKWASELREKGVRRISGDVIGDDDLFSDELLASGWKESYRTSAYAAQSSALSFHENCVKVYFDAGPSVGSPAPIRLSPSTDYVTIEGVVKTGPASQRTVIGFERIADTNRIQVRGSRSMRKENRYDYTTIHNPTLFAATVLAETFEKHGIVIEGRPVDIDDLPKDDLPDERTLLFEHLSPPLPEILKKINKESENLYANQLFLSVGAERFPSAGWAESATAVKEWMAESFIDPQGLVMDDGSGLSILNRATARQLAGVLEYMHYHPDGEVYRDSLAVAGEDGTYRKRLVGVEAAGRVFAKTGYIQDVRTLSGYVVTLEGETLVFSFLLNNAERIGSRFKWMVDQTLTDLVFLK